MPAAARFDKRPSLDEMRATRKPDDLNLSAFKATFREDLRGRNFITTRSPAQWHPQATFQDERCKATIVLDGTEYRCMRKKHDNGIHDGFCKHNHDGGLVRW